MSGISLMNVKEYCTWVSEKAVNHKNNPELFMEQIFS